MTECAQCGDCCERIVPNATVPDLRRRLADPYYAGRLRAQAELLIDMLTKIDVSKLSGRPVYSCRHFDAVTRLCTAHEKRPDMCRGYPWYTRGNVPSKKERERHRLPRDMSPRCSFTADLRPMLPIVEVR